MGSSEHPDVPRSLWSRILARSSTMPDVLFYFLREKPNVRVTQNRIATTQASIASRKRKRDEW